MTELLAKALELVAKLPGAEQDGVAMIILAELASEQQWADSFAKSQDKLAKLGQQALEDYRTGRTTPL